LRQLSSSLVVHLYKSQSLYPATTIWRLRCWAGKPESWAERSRQWEGCGKAVGWKAGLTPERSVGPGAAGSRACRM